MSTTQDPLEADWSGPVEHASVSLDDPSPGVRVLTLASEPLGVLRQAVKRAIREALLASEADPAVRVLIVTGTGRAFSVGSDVKEFAADADWLGPAARVDQGLNLLLESSRLPVIAALNGLTMGGGLELALACDLRLAAASAALGLPEVMVGAFASGGGTQRLPRIVGPGRAMELLLTGRSVDAEEALRLGLVEEVLPDASLMTRAVVLASRIASMPVAGIAATKACLQEGLRHGQFAGHRLENELTVTVGLTQDAIEGQRAFVEKRVPRFGSGIDWTESWVRQHHAPALDKRAKHSS